MITVTFIRHGESEDNLRPIWAGWKDAPLSELGRKQAHALGASLSTTRLTHIYASPLLRAHTTGLAVHAHQPAPQPPFTVSPHLREQHFGIAEGHSWVMHAPDGVTLEEMYARKVYPVLYGREEKFPDGESLDDLARRAEEALRECVLPHVKVDGEGEAEGTHVALASHGLCISELMSALVRLDPEAKKGQKYSGLLNTAWTRVEIRVRGGHNGPIDPSNPPPLEVKMTHFNHKDHLDTLKDFPHTHVEVDGARAEAKAFFGGETTVQA